MTVTFKSKTPKAVTFGDLPVRSAFRMGTAREDDVFIKVHYNGYQHGLVPHQTANTVGFPSGTVYNTRADAEVVPVNLTVEET